MVEFTNIQDNSEEIMNCIVNCDTAQDPDNKADENPSNNMANEEEYIDEP
ncbi:hypothetical protein [Paenibacillus foliorum]|nr:hypothetical protein [Paenibacillus foliorum]